MPFTPRIDADFYGNARRFIKGNEGFKPTVYNPGDHVPTIGYGYALVVEGQKGWVVNDKLTADLAAIQITLTPTQATALADIAQDLQSGNTASADIRIANLASNFPSLTQAQATTLFDRTLDRALVQVKNRFRTHLGAADGDFLYAELVGSTELIVLADLAFNVPSLVGRGLTRAIWNNDRAEAWYEIRYNTNSESQDPRLRAGIANRRYQEAALFSLYNENPTEEDYKSAYRMFARHRDGMRLYEGAFPPDFANDPAVHQLEIELETARSWLTSTYIDLEGILITVAWNNVLVGESDGTDGTSDTLYYRRSADDSDTYALRGSEESDLIFGEGGDDELIGNGGADVLYGGTGTDILDGGAGDDILDGGVGDDIYRYRPGDGNDVIRDADGQGRILLFDASGNFEIVAIGVREASDPAGVYRSPDGAITLTQNSPLTIHDGSGGTITIENFQPGDFGITLLDLPADPTTLTEWPALDPDASEPNWSGLRNGTPYNDYDSSPDSNVDLNGDGIGDIGGIAGTSGAEIIHGLAGDDYIDGYGGADRLYGDEGNDYIYFYAPDPVGDAFADGGAGRDVIFGESLGNNHFIGGLDADPNDQADLIVSSLGNDHLEGGRGDDLLMDYSGADILEGGIGDDYLYSNASFFFVDHSTWSIGPVLDVINAVQFDGASYQFPAPQTTGINANFAANGDTAGDVLLGAAGNDYLSSGSGNDVLDVGADADTAAETNLAFAGLGNDVLIGGAGRDWLFADGGDDTLIAGGGDDMLFGDEAITAGGAAGNDYLAGGTGADTMYGHGGDDVLLGGADNDTMLGGVGSDTLYGEEGNDLLQGGDGIGVDGNDALYGEAGDDTLLGEEGDDYLSGGDGIDVLDGGAGADILDGGKGDDHVYIGDGDRIVHRPGDGSDYLYKVNGSTPTDPITLFDIDISDVLSEDVQIDQVLGSDGRQWLRVAIDAFDALYLQNGFIDDGQSFEFHDDTLTQQQFMQYAPALNIVGTASADRIYGSNQNDTIDGGAGNDTLDGQGGDDTYIIDSTGDAVAEGIDNGTDTVLASASYALGANIENLTLTGIDNLDGMGNALGNVLVGNSGHNTLSGGAGDDRLTGGAGSDNLNGGEGDDTLIGGAGSDYLAGAIGNDAYFFGRGDGSDRIEDTSGQDALVMNGLNRTDVSFIYVQGGDLRIRINDTDESVDVSNFLNSTGSSVGTVQFADGTTLGVDDIKTQMGFQSLPLAGDGSGPVEQTISGSTTGDNNIVLNADPSNPTQFVLTANNLSSDGFNWFSLLSTHVSLGTYAQFTGFTIQGNDLIMQWDTLIDGAAQNTNSTLTVTDFFDIYTYPGNPFGFESLTYTYVNEAAAIAVPGTYVKSLDTGPFYLVRRSYMGYGYVDHMLISGTEGNDVLQGEEPNNVFYAKGGNDVMYGKSRNDTFYSGGGMDTMYGGAGSDTYYVDGNDTLYDGGDQYSTDTLYVMNASSLADVSLARIGDDLLVNDNRIIRFFERNPNSSSTDSISKQYLRSIEYMEGQGWSVDLMNYASSLGLVGVIHGTEGNDTITGDVLNNTIYAYGGNDRVDAGGGHDFVYGGDGDDSLDGKSGDDHLEGGDGTDSLQGDYGNDRLHGGDGMDFLQGWFGDDILDGGPGHNDQLAGGPGNDILFGGDGDDYLDGEDPATSYWGYYGNDTLDGGAGDDTLLGGQGSDTYIFNIGGGIDDIWESGTIGKDVVVFGEGIDSGSIYYVWDSDQASIALSTGISDVFGREDGIKVSVGIEEFRFADGTVLTLSDILAKGTTIARTGTLDGTNQNDVLIGAFTSDQLYGNEGKDVLFGAGRSDYIVGGDGDDIIIGGSGMYPDRYNGTIWGDDLYGGTGNDVYAINRADVSNDFIWDEYVEGVTENDIDAISFGGIRPDEVAAYFDIYQGSTYSDVYLELKIAGLGKTEVSWTYTNTSNNTTYFEDYRIERVQFLGTGDDRVFDLKSLVEARYQELLLGTDSNPIALFTPEAMAQFDITSQVGFAGGEHALHYALTGEVLLTPISDGIVGTAGDDTLTGTLAADQIIGLAGNDALQGLAGDDELQGDTGNDVLAGGTGSDTYIYNVGDGIDTIDDAHVDGELNALVFGAGIDPAAITLGIDSGSLVVRTGNAGDEVHLSGFDPANPYSTYAIDTFQFADGTVLSYGELLARGFAFRGTADADLLAGTAVEDRLLGLAGDDLLQGNEGDDTLSGGEGSDTLDGGAGNDYLDGGVGADAMAGGAGNDVYLVDNAGDTTTELDNEGIDSVRAGISYALEANLENVTLTGVEAIDATGNALNNVLTGNVAANVLAGLDGDDTLSGLDGNDTLQGGSGNDYLNGGVGADTLLGGAGNDIYLVDDQGDVITERANEGIDSVRASVTYTLGTDVENLTLTGLDAIDGTGNTLNNVLTGNGAANVLAGLDGDDTLSGLDGNDTLQGGAGNDYLNGGLGADALAGGSGNDIYLIDDAGDTIAEFANEGVDSARSGVSFTLADHIENLTLTGVEAIDGTGNAQNNVLTGNAAANVLAGHAGDDTLSGLDGNDTLLGGEGNDYLDGGQGADVLVGGAGNDVYLVDEAGDSVTEALNEGIDSVRASVTHALGDNLESLTLTGIDAVDGTGNGLDNVLTGNVSANVLTGLDGNDTLSGLDGNDMLLGGAGNDYLNGGIGADAMAGGVGNDVYLVDDLADTTIEDLDAGIDSVRASVTHVLGDNVENLTLTGTEVIDGTGNATNNVLTGNDAANVLTGLAGDDTLSGLAGDDTLNGGDGNDYLNGGLGADSLIGGLGNDIYLIDHVGDVATELADEGIDSVRASVTHTLGTHFENLTLTGLAAIDGTGNTQNNVLTGNAAANLLAGLDGDDTLSGGDGADTLDGGTGNDYLNGGTGADTFVGGPGNDIYVIDDVGDLVTELADEGIDSVRASVSHTLATHVENLTLTGTAAIDGTGNTGNNVLTGNAAANRLAGLEGADTLSGGDGDDTLDGGIGNDYLNGGLGADILIGGAGNDVLRGGVGNDTYHFGAGDGQDSLYDLDATVGNADQVIAGAGLLDMVFTSSGSSLMLTLHGTGDQLTIQSWYGGADYQIETVEAVDGRVLLNTQVDQLIQAMATFSADNGGITWDQALDTRPDEVQAIVASYWQAPTSV